MCRVEQWSPQRFWSTQNLGIGERKVLQIRSYWGWGSPKSNNSVLIRESRGQCESEDTGKATWDRGRDWSDTATSEGWLGLARSWKGRKDSPPEPRTSASRAVRINVCCLGPQSVGLCYQLPQETNPPTPRPRSQGPSQSVACPSPLLSTCK